MSPALTSPVVQLPPGRQSSTHEEVTAIQRGRLMAAALEAVEDVGYARMTISQVIGRARVSRKTFYDLFEDREHCFLLMFEQALASARELAEQAYLAEPNWRDGVRSALAALLELMDESPGLAKLFVVETLAGGERVLERRTEVLDELARTIHRGRPLAKGYDPPILTAEALVGGIIAVLHTRLVRDDRKSFRSLLGPLMSVIVLPYLGTRAAAEELGAERKRRHTRRRTARRQAEDPLEGLSMRLTYRTMLVLAVIAEHPGASNRQIAEGSGIVDQGQMSKLLSRLAGLGLVENTGAGQAHGAANEWRLTARGAHLERATRRH